METIKIDISKKVKLKYLPEKSNKYLCVSLFLSDKTKEDFSLSVLTPYLVNYSKPMEKFCEKYLITNKSADIFQVHNIYVFQSSLVILNKFEDHRNFLMDLFIAIYDIISLKKWTIDFKLADEARKSLKYKRDTALEDSTISLMNMFFEEINPESISTGVLPVNSRIDLENSENNEQYINKFFRELFEKAHIDIYISGDLNLNCLYETSTLFEKLPIIEDTEEKSIIMKKKLEYKEYIGVTNENLDLQLLGYKLPTNEDTCIWKERIILDSLLASLPQSRITKRISKMGLGYIILSGVDWVNGYIWIMCKCKTENSPDIKRLIEEEIALIRDGKISIDEFNMLKESTEIRFKIGVNTNVFMKMRFDFELMQVFPKVDYKECFESFSDVSYEVVIKQVKDMKLKLFYWNKCEQEGEIL